MPAPKKSLSPEDFLALMGEGGTPRICAVCQLSSDKIAAIDHALRAGRTPGAVCKLANELWGLTLNEGSFRGHRSRHLK